MEASLYFGGKSHVSNGCKMYLLRSPVSVPQKPAGSIFVWGLSGHLLHQLDDHIIGHQLPRFDHSLQLLSCPEKPQPDAWHKGEHEEDDDGKQN